MVFEKSEEHQCGGLNVVFLVQEAATQISQVLYSEVEGSVFCTFTRPAGGNRSISGGKIKDFDLTKEKFYILYSTAGVSSCQFTFLNFEKKYLN